tara:strand:+ start:2712 stop:2954 length:243 start_codon:yes stop_codon:yes gene_type:complete
MSIYTTIGLYADGSFKINGVEAKDLETHIQYNKNNRPGRALFVDGKCIYSGYISEKEVKSFEEKIKTEKLIKNKCTKPYN